MKKRIIGIDVARALAVIGMIVVNFKVVFGGQGNNWLKAFAHLFDGKAAATFVVLAGIGLALMTNSAYRNGDGKKLAKGRRRIVKRALFLFVIGLSYIWIWPADILHFYGIYMLFVLAFIDRRERWILWGTVLLIIGYPMLLALVDYETGWDFSTLTYRDFWSLEGFFRNLFFNGFHPVIPWAGFMLFGLWYGRQNLYDDHFLKRSLRIGLVVFLAVQVLSWGLLQLLSEGDPVIAESLQPILGTDPMPPMPFYMINGISIATVIISACILVAKRNEDHPIVSALHKTGKLALTFYVVHVVVGMGLVEVLLPWEYGEYSIGFSLVYALGFSLLCVGFAVIWLKHKKAGPLEWLMRKVTG